MVAQELLALAVQLIEMLHELAGDGGQPLQHLELDLLLGGAFRGRFALQRLAPEGGLHQRGVVAAGAAAEGPPLRDDVAQPAALARPTLVLGGGAGAPHGGQQVQVDDEGAEGLGAHVVEPVHLL